MQDLGFITVKDERILVLYRATKHGRMLRIRNGKKENWLGTSLHDESAYLEERPDLVERLKAGETIKV